MILIYFHMIRGCGHMPCVSSGSNRMAVEEGGGERERERVGE